MVVQINEGSVTDYLHASTEVKCGSMESRVINHLVILSASNVKHEERKWDALRQVKVNNACLSRRSFYY